MYHIIPISDKSCENGVTIVAAVTDVTELEPRF